MASGSRKGVAWLYSELPELVSKGVLTEESANALRSHYGELPRSLGQRVLIAILAALGAMLIGGGVILVLAHNWDELSRPVRTVLSYLPLLVAQVLMFYAFLRQADSVAWRESTALFQSLMVGAAISLIAQTYNISGDFQGFMRTWMLLVLPLIYLCRSTLVALFYFGAFVIWGFSGDVFGSESKEQAWQYWMLLLPVLPHYVFEFRRDPLSWSSAALGYVGFAALALTSHLVLGTTLAAWILFYSGLLVAAYAVDQLSVSEEGRMGSRPLGLIGTVGLGVFIFIVSFRDIWPGANQYHPWEDVRLLGPFFFAQGIGAALIMLIFSGIAGARAWRRVPGVDWVLLLFPVISVVAYLASLQSGSFSFSAVLMNLYGVVWGVSSVVRGLRSMRWGETNLGLILLSALILARFFDSDFTLLARGLAFVVLGAGCLTVNYFLWRKAQENVK